MINMDTPSTNAISRSLCITRTGTGLSIELSLLDQVKDRMSRKISITFSNEIDVGFSKCACLDHKGSRRAD